LRDRLAVGTKALDLRVVVLVAALLFTMVGEILAEREGFESA
jgi:hypothetical protein